MAQITLNAVCVDIPIYDATGRSMKSQLIRIGRSSQIENNRGVVIVRALNELSFSLEEGDRVGLIGHNGAGKSTLLRVLAGIYQPTSGVISREGKTIPLLDLSLGMEENCTGYQNIRMRGLLLGMSSAEIEQKTSEIADFTELGDYLKLPLRTYSSGMRVRLAFSISTAVDAEILLLDEIIGAGDASFIHKANARLSAMRNSSKIVVLASHDNNVIRQFCNKALWMEHGRLLAFGETEQVVCEYERATAQ